MFLLVAFQRDQPTNYQRVVPGPATVEQSSALGPSGYASSLNGLSSTRDVVASGANMLIRIVVVDIHTFVVDSGVAWS